MEREPTTRSEQDALLTIPETARRLHIGRRQLDNAVAAGQLALYDLGTWPRLRWHEVLSWLDGQRRRHGDTVERSRRVSS